MKTAKNNKLVRVRSNLNKWSNLRGFMCCLLLIQINPISVSGRKERKGNSFIETLSNYHDAEQWDLISPINFGMETNLYSTNFMVDTNSFKGADNWFCSYANNYLHL